MKVCKGRRVVIKRSTRRSIVSISKGFMIYSFQLTSLVPIGIRFKYFDDAYFLKSLHPKLKEIFNFVVYEADKKGFEVEVTSVYRSTGGVHSLFRGIDLVPVDRDVEKMEWIRGIANDNFDYGKEGFEVCPPIRHGTGKHNHLQSRDETTRIENAHI